MSRRPTGCVEGISGLTGTAWKVAGGKGPRRAGSEVGNDVPAPSTLRTEEGIRAFSPVSWSRSRSSGNNGSVGDNLDGGRTAARAMGGPGRDWARAGGA